MDELIRENNIVPVIENILDIQADKVISQTVIPCFQCIYKEKPKIVVSLTGQHLSNSKIEIDTDTKLSPFDGIQMIKTICSQGIFSIILETFKSHRMNQDENYSTLLSIEKKSKTQLSLIADIEQLAFDTKQSVQDIYTVFQKISPYIVDAVEERSQITQGKVLFLGNFNRLNHSCNANCFISFHFLNDWNCSVVTKREILPGEELTISYWPDIEIENLVTRQITLKLNKEFECHCARCNLEQYFKKTQDEENLPKCAFASENFIDPLQQLRLHMEEKQFKNTRILFKTMNEMIVVKSREAKKKNNNNNIIYYNTLELCFQFWNVINKFQTCIHHKLKNRKKETDAYCCWPYWIKNQINVMVNQMIQTPIQILHEYKDGMVYTFINTLLSKHKHLISWKHLVDIYCVQRLMTQFSYRFELAKLQNNFSNISKKSALKQYKKHEKNLQSELGLTEKITEEGFNAWIDRVRFDLLDYKSPSQDNLKKFLLHTLVNSSLICSSVDRLWMGAFFQPAMQYFIRGQDRNDEKQEGQQTTSTTTTKDEEQIL